MNIKYYYFIDEFNKNEIEKLSAQISLIYRNYHKKNDPNELKKLVMHCKNNRRKVYISNNLKDAIKYNFDGLYIPSFHKQLRFRNIAKKNLEIIGSAHNYKELDVKKKQGCTSFIYSRLFKTKYDYKPGFLGIIRFNLLKLSCKKDLVPLGGINYDNLNKLNLINTNSFVLMSEIKKKPAKIFSRLF